MAKDNIVFSKSFLISLALHAIFFSALLGTVSFNTKEPPVAVNLQTGPKPPEIVKATMINKAEVDAALKRQADAQAKEQQQRKAQQEQLAIQQRQTEELRKQAELARQAVVDANKQKMKLENDAKLAIAEKAKLLQEQQQIKQKMQAAAKKEQEKKDLAIKQAADKKAEEIRAKAAADKAIAQKAEKDRLQQLIVAKEVDKYRAEFQALIEDNRILSGVFNGTISCKIRIILLPDGSIASVNIVKPSGNSAYDEMSAASVYKSAPFPMPQDPELYNQLRDIVLSFENGDQSDVL